MQQLTPEHEQPAPMPAKTGPAAPRRRTLVMLLLVLLACGIWAAVAAWHRRPSRAALAQSWLRGLRASLLLFEAERGRLPTQQEGLDILLNPPPAPGAQMAAYVHELRPDPWGRPYVYHAPPEDGSAPRRFRVLSVGPDGKEGTGDDIVEAR